MATVIEGDATDPDILRQAGIANADVIAALTGLTGQNLAVCMAAEKLAPDTRTVARIDRAETATYADLVDDVIFPEQAGARVAANRITGGTIQALADVTGEIEILEIQIADGAPAAGRTLAEVQFPSGTLIVSGGDGQRIARPGTTLEVGSRYLIAVEPDVMDEVVKLLRG